MSTDTRGVPYTINFAPRLPDNWRTLLAEARQAGYPNTPRHQQAYANFVRVCFPHVDSTDPEAREHIDAWWVLETLPFDGRWQYWLTADGGKGRKKTRRKDVTDGR